MSNTPFPTRKAAFPGTDALNREFAAVATPAQIGLAATLEWATTPDEARYGNWELCLANSTTVVFRFYRAHGTVRASIFTAVAA